MAAPTSFGKPLVRSTIVALVALALAISGREAQAQSLSAALRIPSPDKGVPFGGALAGSANKIAVGGGFIGGFGVIVYDGTAGGILTVLGNPTNDPSDRFGAAVAWVGDDVLVGAPLADVAGTDRGAAYLFDGATGALLHTFTRPDGIAGWFGFSVAGLGGEALVGVLGLLGTNGEGVYRFDGTTGAPLGTLADPNGGTANAGRFGATVITAGGDVYVSSSFGASAVYRFDAGGTLLQTYQDPEPADAEEFGEAIAVSGSHVAIGVGLSLNPGGGKVYLFDVATGALEHTYPSPFASDSLFFGQGLGGLANAVAIGSGSGVFTFETAPPYDLLQTLHAPTPFADDRDGFGQALAPFDGSLLIGAVFTAYVFDLCGNGITTAREQCDDGNVVDGDGCSGACRLEVCGTAPAAGCVMATKSSLSVRKENSIYGEKDALKWTWAGPATDLSTLGDPLTTADLVLCVYDLASSPTPRLKMQPVMPAGGFCGIKPCWKARGATGFGYGDRFLTPSGITKAKLGTGGSSTKASVLGKGPDLGVVASGGGVDLFGQVTVQLRSSTSPVCLQADFPAPAQANAKGLYRDAIP